MLGALVRTLFAAFLFSVTILPLWADEFHLAYSSSGTPEEVVVLPGEHHFIVDGVPANSTTEWELYVVVTDPYQGNPLDLVESETDVAGDPAVDPELTYAFSILREYQLRAYIYSSPDVLEKFLTWNIAISSPNLVILSPIQRPVTPESMTANPAAPLAGEPFTLRAAVYNAGNYPASGGDEADQEVHFFFNSVFIGAVSYDDLPGKGTPVLLESPELTIDTPGVYSFRACADATNVVEEFGVYEAGNNRTVQVTVRGPNWKQMPDIEGLSPDDAQAALDAAGIFNETVITQFSPHYPDNEVWNQSPNAHVWFPPDVAVTVFVNFHPCEIEVLQPATNTVWNIGTKQAITWESTGACKDTVKIELWQDGTKIRNIKKRTENDGEFVWKIKRFKFVPGIEYSVRVLSDQSHDDATGDFSLVDK